MWKEEISATLWFICMKAESPMQLGSLTRITDLQCLLQASIKTHVLHCFAKMFNPWHHGTMAEEGPTKNIQERTFTYRTCCRSSWTWLGINPVLTPRATKMPKCPHHYPSTRKKPQQISASFNHVWPFAMAVAGISFSLA